MLESLINGLVQDARNRDEEHERILDQVHESSLVTLTPWLRRTGWVRTFMGKNMKTLSDLALKPTAGEVNLLRIWNAVGRVIPSCFTGVKDCWDRGWALILYWLISSRNTEDSSKPFRMYFADSTITRYTSYWQRFIVFCLRSLEDPEQFGVEFSDKQLNGLYDLRATVEFDEVSDDILDKMVSSNYLLLIVDLKSID